MATVGVKGLSDIRGSCQRVGSV